jgi:hypothetical protein
MQQQEPRPQAQDLIIAALLFGAIPNFEMWLNLPESLVIAQSMLSPLSTIEEFPLVHAETISVRFGGSRLSAGTCLCLAKRFAARHRLASPVLSNGVAST